jgi:glycosyltransferase involved in cell wall biosynthesis
MKFSIIMPTYNDSKSILGSIKSLVDQTYDKWELIIINDGSTDNTENLILDFINQCDKADKIKYLYQANNDQLNAIAKSINYIKGNYVFILHSDDLLPSNNFLEKCHKYIIKYPHYDCYVGDLIIIDHNDKVKGKITIPDFFNKGYIPPILLVWLGRNLYSDCALHKKKVFINQVAKNYVAWNMPFWIDCDKKVKMLNIKKLAFPILKYRVHDANYISNEIGKLNVINGELRMVSRLLRHYHIPLYKIQFYIFRIFNKLRLNKYYRPIYFKREAKNKHEIIEFVLKKRFGKNYINYIFLNNLLSFYQNSNHRKVVVFDDLSEDIIYKGKDIKKFNEALMSNELPALYIRLLDEMKLGFNEIIIKDKTNRKFMKDILKFLCIYPYVKITLKR